MMSDVVSDEDRPQRAPGTIRPLLFSNSVGSDGCRTDIQTVQQYVLSN